MNWNKVNLKVKEKNLPEAGKRVLWATTDGARVKGTFVKFLGCLTNDGKYVDSGLDNRRLTSNYWWCDITDPTE